MLETCRGMKKLSVKQILCIIIISWRYSPGWALASATICLQVPRSLALSLHSFIPIFLTSMDTSSSHLILGLPLRLVAYSFPYSIFFGIAVFCILSICPSHLILWHLINLTMFSPLIMASNSSFRRILHNSFFVRVCSSLYIYIYIYIFTIYIYIHHIYIYIYICCHNTELLNIL